MPGCPFAEGGPSKNTNCGHPSRSVIDFSNTLFLFQLSSTILLVSVRFRPLCSANFLAILILLYSLLFEAQSYIKKLSLQRIILKFHFIYNAFIHDFNTAFLLLKNISYYICICQ